MQCRCASGSRIILVPTFGASDFVGLANDVEYLRGSGVQSAAGEDILELLWQDHQLALFLGAVLQKHLTVVLSPDVWVRVLTTLMENISLGHVGCKPHTAALLLGEKIGSNNFLEKVEKYMYPIFNQKLFKKKLKRIVRNTNWNVKHLKNAWFTNFVNWLDNFTKRQGFSTIEEWRLPHLGTLKSNAWLLPILKYKFSKKNQRFWKELVYSWPLGKLNSSFWLSMVSKPCLMPRMIIASTVKSLAIATLLAGSLYAQHSTADVVSLRKSPLAWKYWPSFEWNWWINTANFDKGWFRESRSILLTNENTSN